MLNYFIISYQTPFGCVFSEFLLNVSNAHNWTSVKAVYGCTINHLSS